MAIEVLAPHMSCVCASKDLDEAKAQGYKEIYMITSNGIFKHHQLRGDNRFLVMKVEKIPGYVEPVVKEQINFLPAGKVPFVLFQQVEAFFRKVIQIKGSALEAMIFILWNPTQGYHLYVPTQSVGAARVEFNPQDLPAGSIIVIDIHSHNSMGAFFSGTDDHNDSTTVRFSGVFGQLQNPVAATIWRFNYYTKKFAAQVSDMFEIESRPELEVPQEWMDQVKVQTYTRPPYQGNAGFTGNRIPGAAEVTGNGGNVVRRNTDHLKPFQFPKNPANKASSPSALNGTSNPNDFEDDIPFVPSQFNNFASTEVEDEMEEFYRNMGIASHGEPVTKNGIIVPVDNKKVWRYDPNAISTNASSNENALVDMSEDPNVNAEVGAYQLGKYLGENQSFSPNEQDLNSNEQGLTTLITDERYESIVATHGLEVADAWWAIDNELHLLNGKDEILANFMTEMVDFMSDDGFEVLFKSLFDKLTPRARQKIEQYGM